MAKTKTPDLPAMEGDGIAPKRIKPLETAVDKYIEARDNRMELTKQEVTTRDRVVALMHEHNVSVYTYDGCKVTLGNKESIKVKTGMDGDESDGE